MLSPSFVAHQRPLGEWALRLRVLASRRGLDRRLAQGTEADQSPALRLRAFQLLQPKYRSRLASDLEHLVEESEEGAPRLSAAAPFEYGRVLAAREELLAAADALRNADLVHARGVAMLTVLFTDAASPLYAATDHDLLELYLEASQGYLLEGAWK